MLEDWRNLLPPQTSARLFSTNGLDFSAEPLLEELRVSPVEPASREYTFVVHYGLNFSESFSGNSVSGNIGLMTLMPFGLTRVFWRQLFPQYFGPLLRSMRVLLPVEALKYVH